MSNDNAQMLYSSFGNDPDMAELVEMFVDELPDRIASLQQLLTAADWDELGRLAHQMKGACGSYGFDELTPLAGRVERASRGGEPEQQIHAAVAELSDALRRARSGGPCSANET